MAARGGDSKQALTVALVLFVLLSIILAVVAFFGYSEQGELNEKLAKSKSELALYDKERNHEKFFKVVYKLAAGHAEQDKQDDQRNDPVIFAGLAGQYKEELKAELARMKKKNPALDWPEGKDRPTASYLDQIGSLKRELKQEGDKQKAFQKAAEDAEKEKTAAVTQLQNEQKKFEKTLEDLKTDRAKVVEVKSDGFKALQQKNVDLGNENKALNERLGAIKDETDKKIADLEKQVAQLRAARKSLEEKIAPINMLSLDPPKGKVVSVDRSGWTVYIDLGSADRVKPQLKFSIFGTGTDGKAKTEAKGTLEVTEVLYPHVAKARVTGLRNANRDPVMPGDLLFNPAFHPTLRERVAIAGVIDLTGDGKDSTLQFVRDLEEQGIIVDAYVDFKDGKEGVIKGKGVTRQTTYLIEGTNPGSIKVTELKKQAVDLGVTTVEARRFIALMGYKMSRNASGVADWSGYTRPGQLSDDKMIDKRDPDKKLEREVPKEKEPPKDKDAPKEEKKDAPKEDK